LSAFAADGGSQRAGARGKMLSSTSSARPRHVLGTSSARPRHVLGTSSARPRHVLGTFLARPLHVLIRRLESLSFSPEQNILLTSAGVDRISHTLLRGKSVSVSSMFDVSPKTIRDIWNRRTWQRATHHLWKINDAYSLKQGPDVDTNLFPQSYGASARGSGMQTTASNWNGKARHRLRTLSTQPNLTSINTAR
jgi:hypothetical protein